MTIYLRTQLSIMFALNAEAHFTQAERYLAKAKAAIRGGKI